MPKVQQYGESKVNTQVSRGARANAVDPGAFGGQIGAAVGQLGSALGAMDDRVSLVEAEETMLKFEKDKNDLFFNPEKGYFNSQGRDAYDQAPMVREQLSKLKNNYLSTLKSEKAKQAFSRVADAQLSRADVDVMNHSSKGLKAWEIGTIEAQVENSIENATLYWNDTAKLAEQKSLGEAAFLDAAKMKGMGPEETAEKLQTYRSSFASSAVQAAMTRSSKEGENLLSKFDKELEGPDKLKLQSAIAQQKEAEYVKYQAQMATVLASGMVDKYSWRPDGRAAAMAEIDQIQDPEIRKKTYKETMYLLDNVEKAKKEARGNVFLDAENFIASGGTVEQFQAQNPEGWLMLEGKQKKSLAAGNAIATDYTLLSNLMTLPQKQLAKVNPVDYYDKLDKGARDKLISAVKAAGNGDNNQIGRTRITQTTTYAKQALGEKGFKDPERLNAYHQLVDDEVRYREEILKRELSPDEFTEVLKNTAVKTVKERSILGIPLGTSTRDELLKDVPADKINAAAAYLRSQGKEVNSATISQLIERAKEKK